MNQNRLQSLLSFQSGLKKIVKRLPNFINEGNSFFSSFLEFCGDLSQLSDRIPDSNLSAPLRNFSQLYRELGVYCKQQLEVLNNSVNDLNTHVNIDYSRLFELQKNKTTDAEEINKACDTSLACAETCLLPFFHLLSDKVMQQFNKANSMALTTKDKLNEVLKNTSSSHRIKSGILSQVGSSSKILLVISEDQ